MRTLLPLLLAVSACTPVEPSQGWAVPFEPLTPAEPPVDGGPAPSPARPDDVFSAGSTSTPPVEVAPDTDTDTDTTPAPSDPEPFTVAPPAAEAPAQPEVAPATEAEPPASPPAWSPEAPVRVAWGVRLVGTLPTTQPPRAVLALGTGEERVVEPGTMLPEARLVVLAIGARAVQVAHVAPDGDRARVQTEILYPFYEGAPGARPTP